MPVTRPTKNPGMTSSTGHKYLLTSGILVLTSELHARCVSPVPQRHARTRLKRRHATPRRRARAHAHAQFIHPKVPRAPRERALLHSLLKVKKSIFRDENDTRIHTRAKRRSGFILIAYLKYAVIF